MHILTALIQSQLQSQGSKRASEAPLVLECTRPLEPQHAVKSSAEQPGSMMGPISQVAVCEAEGKYLLAAASGPAAVIFCLAR